MKKYDQYKNSGVEWLGEIPAHWEAKKLKFLGNAIIGLTYSPNDLCDENIGTLVLRSSNIFEGKLKYGEKENVYVKSKIPEKLKIKPKDIIICSRNGSRDLIGKCAIATKNDTGNSFGAFTTVFRSDINNFIYYFLNSSIFKSLSGIFLTSTINQLTIGNLNSIDLAVPPKEEQIAIANFLDDKTTKIDQAIAIKQKQIELVKERRQILIHKAVTKGLNDKVKLKDSGVEWIGEIPEHWEVSRLKNHMTMITGFPFKSEKYTEEGIKLARGINVKEGVLNWNETRCWPTLEPHLVDYLLKDGDVLIAMDGSKVGKNFCQVKESDLPILLLQRVARLRTKTSLLSSFLYSHIINRNFLQWVEMTKTDPMVPHISPDDIKNFQVTIPPLEEQKHIVEFIETATNKITTAISLKEKEIEKLKEYKMSLIDGVVTGKVKVC